MRVDGGVTIWQQGDGFWRWGWQPYDEDGRARGSVEMVSFRTYDSFAEARESARESFPHAVLPDPPKQHRRPSPPGHAMRRALPARTRVVVVVVAVVAVVAVIRLRMRRGSSRRLG